jgi:hypothetical protein
VSSIAAGRDAVRLLRGLLTQLQVCQFCFYMGGSTQIPDGKMGIIDTWRQVLPQKMRERWERRCAAAGLRAPVQARAEAQPNGLDDDKDEDDQRFKIMDITVTCFDELESVAMVHLDQFGGDGVSPVTVTDAPGRYDKDENGKNVYKEEGG